MPLLYSFVARDGLVLCEHAMCQGNFQKVGVECLSKCPKHNARFTYNADKVNLGAASLVCIDNAGTE